MKQELGLKVRNRFPRFMTKEEFYRLVRYCEEFSLDNWGLAIKVCGLMGLRAIECLTIQMQDLDRELNKLSVRLAKTDKIVFRYIPDNLKQDLYSYIGKYKTQIIASGGYLFFTFNNASKAPHLKPSSFGQKIAEICDRLEMGDHIIMANGNKARRIGTHSLRRLFTSELYKQTKDIRVVRDVLHHANAEITSRYISSILFDDEQKQVEKLARNLIKPTPTFTDKDQLNEIVQDKIKELFENMFIKN